MSSIRLINYDKDWFEKIEYASRASTNSKTYKAKAIEKINTFDAINTIESEYLDKVESEYKKAESKSRKFVKTLIEKGHMSILRHSSITFEVICSRSTSLQIVRSANLGTVQESQRYVTFDNDFYTPDCIKHNQEASFIYNNILKKVKFAYDDLLGTGIPREMARYILPNACLTRMVITCNLQAVVDMLTLRNNPETQEEYRILANELFNILCDIMPEIFEYFKDEDGSCIKKWNKGELK